MKPDPKPDPRIVDTRATSRKTLRDPWCRACGHRAGSGHHLIPKGERGDDVEANIVPVCGNGASRCHGAIHGAPYVDVYGKRWTAEVVMSAIGQNLEPVEVAYVLDKLGDIAGHDYLTRRYYLAAR